MKTHMYADSMVVSSLRTVRGFLRNVWGTFHTPYTTYRTLLTDNPFQLLSIFFFIGVYFFLVSPLKLRTLHPLLLTLNTGRLFSFVVMSYLAICLFLFVLGKLFHGKPTLRGIAMTWGYSLIPTLLWFFATSLVYLLLPPPRHETILGKAFSLLFVTFSVSLFLWKGMLYYLTLRFGLHLSMQKIIAVSVVFFPVLIGYSYFLYRIGVFKVPFI